MEKLRPPKQAGAGGFHLVIVRTANWLSGDQDNVPAGLNAFLLQAHDFAQATLDPVAPHSVANATVHSKPKSAVRQMVGQCAQHKQLIGV